MTTQVERQLTEEHIKLRTTLTEAANLRDVAEATVTRSITACREAGVPWSTIGEILGMSRQAAWERYKNVETPDYWDWDTHKSGPECHTDTCSRNDCERPAKWHTRWGMGCGNLCGIHRRQMEKVPTKGAFTIRSTPLEG